MATESIPHLCHSVENILKEGKSGCEENNSEALSLSREKKKKKRMRAGIIGVSSEESE